VVIIEIQAKIDIVMVLLISVEIFFCHNFDHSLE
jgi:hypothetical protein